jgi:imidazolonepropionase-like amidohydrolase
MNKFTLIHNGTLIDGNGGQPLIHSAILIENNVITAVGSASYVRSIMTEPATEINAEGGYILPGFIDTHVHVMLEGVNIARDLQAPFSLRFYMAIQHLGRTLDAGITSVRDAGGADAGVKQAVETGLIRGPRMQISISALSITGGHADGWMRSGNEFQLFRPYPGLPDPIVDGVDNVRKRVREVLRAGADVVKICATGGVLSPTDHPEFIQFSPEELDVIVREARYRKGIKVMAHAQGCEGIKQAVRAGIHSIEHGIFLDDEAIDLMIEKGTFLVPTLLAPLAVLETGEKGGMPDYGIRKARETIEIHSDSIARAYKAGVKIAMGTDAGVMPHGTNLRELGLMCTVGMSPMQSIVATTKTAAECLGWHDRVGTLEKGKLADIIIVREDPIKNIRSLENNANIKLVMKDGVIVKRLN